MINYDRRGERDRDEQSQWNECIFNFLFYSLNKYTQNHISNDYKSMYQRSNFPRETQSVDIVVRIGFLNNFFSEWECVRWLMLSRNEAFSNYYYLQFCSKNTSYQRARQLLLLGKAIVLRFPQILLIFFFWIIPSNRVLRHSDIRDVFSVIGVYFTERNWRKNFHN